MMPVIPGMAMRIIESDLLVIGPFEDWSDVRSPGRAARRRRQGHKQRIRIYYRPDPDVLQTPEGFVMHPATAAKFRAAIAERARRQEDGVFFNVLAGNGYLGGSR